MLTRILGPLADLRRRSRPRPVAFVLSGGGNLGAIQVGMLRALAEARIEPDLIVGCSVGAINGAAFSADPNIVGVARLERIWRRLADGDPELMPSRFIPLVAQMARKGEALHEQTELADLLTEELPVENFGQLNVPFSCVATDLESAEEVWFDEGPLVPALLASAALPAVYPAFELGGRRYIDGGVARELPLGRAVELGAFEIYVLHVGHIEGRSLEVQRPFDSALRAYWTARRFRVEEDFREAADHCVVHRLPAGSSPRLRFDDFSQGAELIDRAYEATAHYLRTGSAPPAVSGPVSPEEESPSEDLAVDDQSAMADDGGNGSGHRLSVDRFDVGRAVDQPASRGGFDVIDSVELDANGG